MTRVTDYIASYILNLGVNDVFLVSGGGMMFLSDGLVSNKKINFYCNHHEQASAMAAVSYAKYTNNLGVAYVTTGCGGTNAITGLLNAWQDNIPCLFISGQVKKGNTTRNSGLKLRQFGVQEFDIISIVEPMSKFAIMVNEPEKIAYYLDKAVYLAKTGRPGPVWLDIPSDVQGAIIDEDKLERFDPVGEGFEKTKIIDCQKIKELEDLISHAKRPIVIAGQGIRLSDTQNEFKNFIEKYNLPVVTPFLGVGIIPTEHPLFIGRIGSKGSRSGNFALQNSDLVISLGSRLSVSSIGFEAGKFAREAKIVVVDIDPIEHQKKLVSIDLFIEADLVNFFSQIKNIAINDNSEWIKKCREWKDKWPVCLSEYANDEKGINLYYFVDQLSKTMSNDAVIVSDAGSAFYATTQAINIKEGQRYITSGGQAEMGYTLPACIGVSVARDKKEVLGITGDGSFQMNIQELQTIVHNNLPIKIFVWNNDGYLSIRASQRKFFDERYIGTDESSGVSFPEVEKIAKAYGIKYFKIDKSSEMINTFKKIYNLNVPVLCEVICQRDQEIVPAISSFKKEDGTMVSRPMEDMYPFLSREEFLENMIIEPIEE